MAEHKSFTGIARFFYRIFDSIAIIYIYLCPYYALKVIIREGLPPN